MRPHKACYAMATWAREYVRTLTGTRALRWEQRAGWRGRRTRRGVTASLRSCNLKAALSQQGHMEAVASSYVADWGQPRSGRRLVHFCAVRCSLPAAGYCGQAGSGPAGALAGPSPAGGGPRGKRGPPARSGATPVQAPAVLAETPRRKRRHSGGSNAAAESVTTRDGPAYSERGSLITREARLQRALPWVHSAGRSLVARVGFLKATFLR